MTDVTQAPRDASRSDGSNSAHPPAAAERTERESASRRVGVLSPHNSTETKAILNAVRALGHEPVWVRDRNVSSRIADGTVHVSPSVDVLVNRVLVTKSDDRLEDLHLAGLYDETTPVVNPPDAVADAVHKFRAGAKLAAAGLPVPDAYLGRSPHTMAEWTSVVDGAAAHKRTIGTNGQRMSRVSPEDPLAPTIEDRQSFVQEFLDGDGERPSDVRVYVVGDEVVAAMRRLAPEGEWRTNVALGGDVRGITDDLDPEARRIATEAAAVLNLDVAGVDLMRVDGEWYVLEVNATAGFKGLFSATGVSAAPYIARLAIERAGGVVDPDAVAELDGALDDSVPDCKPPRGDGSASDGVLGYTNRVTVLGRDGAEDVVAKADTGARRTSIDTELAGRIGVGPLEGTTTVRTGAGGTGRTRPIADVRLRIDGEWRTVTASVADRSHLNYPVLLGRDVLREYTVDVDRTAEE